MPHPSVISERPIAILSSLAGFQDQSRAFSLMFSQHGLRLEALFPP
jgi:hypothetical protein